VSSSAAATTVLPSLEPNHDEIDMTVSPFENVGLADADRLFHRSFEKALY